ncbi:hypothetical protein PPERSA_02386 [Pseudocohnilembus persalinus]|uniref:Uncharacterized protein n=1 Tax=Pseudocohnilembus persalinus TaxID=266149 RepID=A0A0V0Q8K6_PSEPJ|nr:hypothetical protein PPERSA_02386 [Pseudocohnilembus persalinus]|eukprot:KRW98578.1 hypothetical protein PPERSA_02386 [Pseudocohnilembus persalinus]
MTELMLDQRKFFIGDTILQKYGFLFPEQEEFQNMMKKPKKLFYIFSKYTNSLIIQLKEFLTSQFGCQCGNMQKNNNDIKNLGMKTHKSLTLNNSQLNFQNQQNYQQKEIKLFLDNNDFQDKNSIQKQNFDQSKNNQNKYDLEEMSSNFQQQEFLFKKAEFDYQLTIDLLQSKYNKTKQKLNQLQKYLADTLSILVKNKMNI